MKNIKKVDVVIMVIVVLVFASAGNFLETATATASTNQTFCKDANLIKSFKKSGNRLIVTAEGKFYGKNFRKKLSVRKISYKLAKDCKWLDANIDYYLGSGPKYRKSSYKKVKAVVKSQRSDYLKYYKSRGELVYDSPVGVSIVVKKNRIVKVITSGS